ncbi:hypothetical protein MIND_01146700 [Mycena indigotica]|uniref:Uncharacterized protein n=1 Tax=Mycena indigotica TaxID=2126181 RepID=A0A8H6S8C9_9AGAR|nr:uncharacterized protein MIND_01146700 [Mycena indigotica]KAF7293667.1 hypothetical protein MIND_01146700 [Mycena indigotica]
MLDRQMLVVIPWLPQSQASLVGSGERTWRRTKLNRDFRNHNFNLNRYLQGCRSLPWSIFLLQPRRQPHHTIASNTVRRWMLVPTTRMSMMLKPMTIVILLKLMKATTVTLDFMDMVPITWATTTLRHKAMRNTPRCEKCHIPIV